MVTVLHACVVGIGQSAVTLQWTQRLASASFIVSQTGVVPPHAVLLVAVHCTQVLLVVLQAGVVGLPVQFASAVHATHVLVVVSQAGVPPVHCALETHCTQEAEVPPAPLQTSFEGHAWLVLLLPAGSFEHVPDAQVLHVPLHTEPQHAPSTQKPLVHWSLAVHAPVAIFAWQAPALVQ